MATSQIATNMGAIRAHNVFAKNNENMATTLNRVSTGLKINSVKDDLSKYTISERMRERINANQQALQNVQNDNSLSNTASSALENTISILKTLKARALDAANDSNTDEDRAYIQKDINKLIEQIDYNATNVKYNGKHLLDGSVDEKVMCATKTAYMSKEMYNLKDATLSSLDGAVIATSADQASLIVSWTNAGGETFVVDSVTTLTSATKLSDILTQAGGFIDGVSFSTKTANTSLGITDKNGNDISSDKTASAYYAIGDKDGVDGRFKNITIKIIANRDPENEARSKTFTFGGLDSLTNSNLVQRGQDKNDNSPLTFQIGETSGMSVQFSIEDMSSKNLGINELNVTTRQKADGAISSIDDALSAALQQQTTIGAMEQRLGYTEDTLETMNENLQASDSALRDADMSQEISNFMKWSTLSQASQYMLAQANQNAFQVLNLLQ